VCSKPEYTVETKQVLVQAADWLLHTRLREGLADRATWYIGDRIDAEKDLLSRALNRNLNEHVNISGKISDLRPVSVGITTNAIKAVLVADGTVEVSVF
jgi:tRNA U55 pseudouridine synthase TruB